MLTYYTIMESEKLQEVVFDTESAKKEGAEKPPLVINSIMY
jgi:hypothetical protein